MRLYLHDVMQLVANFRQANMLFESFLQVVSPSFLLPKYEGLS
jgi:hypothetical protein